MRMLVASPRIVEGNLGPYRHEFTTCFRNSYLPIRCVEIGVNRRWFGLDFACSALTSTAFLSMKCLSKSLAIRTYSNSKDSGDNIEQSYESDVQGKFAHSTWSNFSFKKINILIWWIAWSIRYQLIVPACVPMALLFRVPSIACNYKGFFRGIRPIYGQFHRE